MKYEQIRNELLKTLSDGSYELGDCLPSERELASSFGVSIFTLRRSLALLEKGGFISRERGRGTFVRRLTPNQAADRLVGSRNVALIVVESPSRTFTDEDLVYSQAEFKSLEEHLGRFDRHLVLTYTRTNDLLEGRLPKALERGAVAGVILDGHVRDFHVDRLKACGLPLVVLGNHPIEIPASQVRFDVEQAAYLSSAALLSCTTGPLVYLCEAFPFHYEHEFLAGYCRACREAGRAKQVRVLTATGDDGREVRGVLETLSGPFALLVHHDVARPLVDLCKELGISFEEHPVLVYGSASHISLEERRLLNVCAADFRLMSAAVADVMENLLFGGSPETVVLTPEVTNKRESGLVRVEMSWHRPEALATSCGEAEPVFGDKQNV